MTIRRLAILGAGGFAREVEWLLHEINSGEEQSDRFRLRLEPGGRARTAMDDEDVYRRGT